MKKLALITSLIVSTSVISNTALAEASEQKKGGIFLGGAAIGALVGGPVGYVIGAATGAYIAEKADQESYMTQTINEQDMHISLLQTEIDMQVERISQADTEIEFLEGQLLSEAQEPVFFTTGSDQITTPATLKLAATIEYLAANETATVSLSGYSDPRGTDGYNLVLSQGRAENVKQFLVDSGIDETRIKSQGYGMQGSTFDASLYDLERRVDIEISATNDVAMN